MGAFHHRVVKLVVISFLTTLILSVVWEFGGDVLCYNPPCGAGQAETSSSRWVHVTANVSFVGVALGIFSLLSLRMLKELQARERMVRKKDAERLSFSADIAHELRTPLAVLRAHLDSLENQNENDQLLQDVDRITRIVEQVLAKSRIEAIEVGPGDVADLAEISASVGRYLAPLVIREGRSIEVIGATAPVLINGNTFALEQALRNLVENALKYSARGSTITIEVRKPASIRVIDRGRGVPIDQRDVIFERFHRADRRGAGSGLGLSIVRRAVEAHGGRVSVEDAPGGGAVFVMCFGAASV